MEYDTTVQVPDEDIKDYVAKNYRIDEVFSDSDIKEYAADNFSPDEVFSSIKLVPVWKCKACIAESEQSSAKGCEFSNHDNPSFIPKMCTGDGGPALWYIQCKFVEDWKGRCTKHAVDSQGYCEEHLGVNCCSCGAQATHSCDETLQLVCGYPLCDDCVHIFMNNKHQHVRKGE